MKGVCIIILLGAVLLVGCDSPERTVDSLRKEIAEFRITPDEKTRVKIEQNFAKLERQVAELQQRGDSRAGELKNQLISLRGDYQAARMSKAVQDAKDAIQGFGEALKNTAKSFEEAFKDTERDGE
jgi:Sec-independent protein translocase protein TatA